MRIAVFSDVHGNAVALDAVLEAIAELGAARVYALGDLVGRGPDPARVLSMIEEREIPRLRGNWEEWVARNDAGTPKRKAWVEASRARMKKKALAHLDDAPDTMSLDLGGHRVVLAHGSPREITERLTACTPVETLRDAVAGAGAEVVAVGHSHHAFVRRVDGTLVVNCGSVGYPVVGDPRPCFALIDLEPGRPPSAELIRVPYAFEANVARAKKHGRLPKGLAKSYFRGLLGNGEEPREPLAWSDAGHDLLVKLLARPTRGVYRALSSSRPPPLHGVLACAHDLVEALALAAPIAPKKSASRALGKLAPLCAALSRCVRAEELVARVPEAAPRLSRARRDLEKLARPKRMIARGLELVALMMSPRSKRPPFAEIARAHLHARARALTSRAERIDDPIDTDGHERLLRAVEQLHGAARVLGPPAAEVLPEIAALESALRSLAGANDAASYRGRAPVEEEWREVRDRVRESAPAIVAKLAPRTSASPP